MIDVLHALRADANSASAALVRNQICMTQPVGTRRDVTLGCGGDPSIVQ